MKWVALVITIVAFFAGAVVSIVNNETPESPPTATHNAAVPHLWSDHKLLQTSPSECVKKASSVLSSLHFQHITKSPYGAFVYGILNGNRASVKCIPIDHQTFVYASVAGASKAVVEELRNSIMYQL